MKTPVKKVTKKKVRGMIQETTEFENGSRTHKVSPPLFRVRKTIGLPNENFSKKPKTKSGTGGLSRFSSKDFDFNKFPSVKPTALPYEIDTEPIVQGCTKRQAMLIALAVALFLVGTAYGDFEALTSNLIH